jgi:hypothetical protein
MFIAVVAEAAIMPVASAMAKPPLSGSTQAQDMAPYSEAIRGLTNELGQQWCDVSDCEILPGVGKKKRVGEHTEPSGGSHAVCGLEDPRA